MLRRMITLGVFSVQGFIYVGGKWIWDRPTHLFPKKYIQENAIAVK